MKKKFKKMLIIIFFVLLLNDFCIYLKHYIGLKEFVMESFRLFRSIINKDIVIYNFSIIYLFLVMTIYFVLNFFRNEE